MKKSILVSIILIGVASVGVIGKTTSNLNLEEPKSEQVAVQEEILVKPIPVEPTQEVKAMPEPVAEVKPEVKKEVKVEKKAEPKVEKLPVGYHANDLTEKSNLSVTEMKNVLENAPRGTLAKYAKYFIEAEKKYSVNAFALAALVAQESAWGTSDRALYQNNLTGYAVYNSKASGKDFDNPGESILKTAQLLKENYLTPGAENFNGTSIQAVNKDYCLTEDSSATDYDWARNINSIANDLEEIYYEQYK